MTGWRMGFAAGPATIIKAINKAQGQSTSNVCSITQEACVEAYNGPQDFLDKMLDAFKERRDYIVSALNNIKGITCNTPQGAFYVFPNISKLLGKKTADGTMLNTSDEFCMYLLNKHLVAAVPGSAFGTDGYLRLSYATNMDTIKKGIHRLEILANELI